jgi:hypothetical protein
MNDLFLSYAHIDDIPLEFESGWVTNFQKVLRARLSMLLGRKVKVFFDPELRRNEEINQTLLIQLSDVHLLLAIISPSYLNSGWCPFELEAFRSAVKSRCGSIYMGNRSRIFKVIKTRVDDPQPEICQGTSIYEFYGYDEAKKTYYEFSEQPGPNRDKRYWTMLEDLAQDITKVIKLINRESLPPPLERAIYLAEVARDLKAERDQMRRELESLDCYVLPDKTLPRKQSDFVLTVRRYLRQSQFSIHLIGEEEGDLVEGDEGQSIVVWQNKLAAELSEKSNFQRLIWIPEQLKTGGSLDEFIMRLQEDEEAQKGADILLRKPFVELKSVARRKLQGVPMLAPGWPIAKLTGPKSVYLIFDKEDIDYISPIQKFLFSEGFEILLPLLDERSNTKAIEGHKRKLEECDGVLIYYGNGTQEWLEYNIQYLDRVSLKKAEGFQFKQAQPLSCKAIYVTDPHTPHKRLFTETQKFNLINAFGVFDPQRLREFIDCVNREA